MMWTVSEAELFCTIARILFKPADFLNNGLKILLHLPDFEN